MQIFTQNVEGKSAFQLKPRALAWLGLGDSSQGTLWIIVLLISILSVLVLVPTASLIWGSIVDSDASRGIHLSLSHFRAVVTMRRSLDASANSLLFAFGSAVVALVLGWSCAWIVERTNTPLKALVYLTAIVSLGTPDILSVSAWLLLLGKVGPVNQVYRALSGRHDLLVNVYSLSGMITVEGFLWSPLAFLLVGSTLSNANSELEEAARISGASEWQTIRSVTCKLSVPSIVAFIMLASIRALESFDVPVLVGLPGHVYVMMTHIYGNMLAVVPPDLGGASAFSLLLLPVLLCLLHIYGRVTRHCEKFATITGKGFRAHTFDLRGFRLLAAGFLLLICVLLLILPVGMLVWVSLLPFYQPMSIAAIKLLCLDNYRAVFSSENLRVAINTLLVAAITATSIVTITVIAAWLVIRRAPGAWAMDKLVTIPLVFPGLVLGVAVMQFFLHVPLPIYGTIWMLSWAFTVKFLPYGMRFSLSGMLRIHPELQEAAGICGATPLETLRRIIVPLVGPSLLAGWLFIFLMSARTLSLAILLSGPSSQTMAVGMFDLWSNGQGRELAALGLLWTMFMAAVAVVFHLLMRRSPAVTISHVCR